MVPQNGALLSICSCEAAVEQAISAEFEYENSYVSNCEGVLCLSNLGTHVHTYISEALICKVSSQASWLRRHCCVAAASLKPYGIFLQKSLR